MKKITLIILYLAAMALLFASCASEESTTKNEQEKEAPEVTEPVIAETSNPSELTKAEAKQLVDDFDAIVTSDPAKTFACGFELNHGDIKALLDDPDLQNSDTIFAMLGYSQLGDSFDLVICIETTEGAGVYRFFDFTQPCPEHCPAYLDDPVNAPPLSSLGGNKGYWFERQGLTAFLESADQGGAKTYFMLKENKWNEGVYGIVCNPDCEGPSESDPYFAPCGTTPACLTIN